MAGLCHYAATYSTFGIKQINGKRKLQFDNNGYDSTITIVSANIVWLKSTWNIEGINNYSYSTDGEKFIQINASYQLTWGFYRGDRIGIFNYNAIEEKGFVDIDWFHYKYSK